MYLIGFYYLSYDIRDFITLIVMFMNPTQFSHTDTAELEMEAPSTLFAKLSDLTSFSELELLRGCCTQGCCESPEFEVL